MPQSPLLGSRAIASIPISGTSVGSDPGTTGIPGSPAPSTVEAALAALQAEIDALGPGTTSDLAAVMTVGAATNGDPITGDSGQLDLDGTGQIALYGVDGTGSDPGNDAHLRAGGDASAGAGGAFYALGADGAGGDGKVSIFTAGSTGIIGQALVSDGADNAVWGQEAGPPFSLGSLGATASPDRADGEWQYGTLTDDTAITLVGVAGLGTQAIQVELAGGSGGFTPSFTNLTLIGSAPSAVGAGDSVIVIAMSRDGGTNWIGGVLGGGGGGTPATTVTDETTWGITPAVGTDTEYARQDHTHGSPTMPTGGAGAQLLITDTPAGSPLVFADILQNDTGTDLLYADA